jgi:hypothetical protein
MDKVTDDALRSAFGQLKIRPDNDAFSSTEVVSRLKDNHQIEVSTIEGLLELKQNGQVVSVPTVLRAFATKPENVGLFVSETDDHTKWDTAKKVAFIAEHGDDAYARKVAKGPLKANVDVANIDISKAEYLSMTRDEKVAWIGNHGLEAQARVLGKKK